MNENRDHQTNLEISKQLVTEVTGDLAINPKLK